MFWTRDALGLHNAFTKDSSAVCCSPRPACSTRHRDRPPSELLCVTDRLSEFESRLRQQEGFIELPEAQLQLCHVVE